MLNQLVDAVSDGVLTACATLTGVMAGANGFVWPSKAGWLAVGVAFLAGTANQWRALRKLPPPPVGINPK